VDTRRVEPPRSGVIVVEGLFALHERLGGAVDLRVFVEAPRATRWARWEAIERRGERGMGVEAARAFFDGDRRPDLRPLRPRLPGVGGSDRAPTQGRRAESPRAFKRATHYAVKAHEHPRQQGTL
jgi:hypothetical protein